MISAAPVASSASEVSGSLLRLADDSEASEALFLRLTAGYSSCGNGGAMNNRSVATVEKY